MKPTFIFISTVLLLFASCKSTKNTTRREPRTVTVKAKPIEIEEASVIKIPKKTAPESNLTNDIIKTALSFEGTRYKYGGTGRSGMDCSGLVYTSYGNHGIPISRSSYEIAKQGEDIKLKEVQRGDLLFFATGRKNNRINHVGLVVDVNNEVLFIHSTTSRGVLVSSLNEGYWKYAFIKAKRIL